MLFNGGRWEGTTFDWLANFWAQGGELVDDSGKPIFGEGENRDKMLKAMNYFKGLVDSGAAPKRVATIKTYDDFNAAAQSGTTAMFFGGHWQHFQLQAAMPPDAFAKWAVAELPGPTPDQRATGTGGWTVAAFSEDPAKIEACASLMREVYMGPANEAGGDLPTRESLFASLPKFQDPYYAKLKRIPGARPCPPGRADLPRDLEPDPDHDGRGPLRLQVARGGARRRLAADDGSLQQGLSIRGRGGARRPGRTVGARGRT